MFGESVRLCFTRILLAFNTLSHVPINVYKLIRFSWLVWVNDCPNSEFFNSFFFHYVYVQFFIIWSWCSILVLALLAKKFYVQPSHQSGFKNEHFQCKFGTLRCVQSLSVVMSSMIHFSEVSIVVVFTTCYPQFEGLHDPLQSHDFDL